LFYAAFRALPGRAGERHMPTGSENFANALPTINSRTKLDDLLQAVAAIPRPQPPDPNIPSSENPSVLRCTLAYNATFQSAIESGKSNYTATQLAEKAFRRALPPLSGQQNITDFIACIAQGMLMEAISGTDGARLLYAAQVAHQAQNGALRRTHRKPNSKNDLEQENEAK
jgi:hypothetical protein